MSRKFVSLFAVVAMLVVPAVVSAQCSNCGTSAPVYSTPISGGAVYGQNVVYNGGYNNGMVYTSGSSYAVQPASYSSQCGSCNTGCNSCYSAPVSSCNSCASSQCCGSRTIITRRRSDCCSTPRISRRGCCGTQSYCNTGCSTACNTGCNSCCNTGCGNCGGYVQQASYNSGCSSCGQVSYAGGCVGCATASSTGVIMGDSAMPVEPQVAPVVASPSDVVTPPVPTEDKAK